MNGMTKAIEKRHTRSGISAVSWMLVLCLAASGCSRAFYRRQADREVYGLVDCGAQATDGELVGYTIQPDHRSRFFDPNCPDLPPMPPDDPTSHQLMQCVDGKHGWPGWPCYGTTPFTQNPDWESFLPVNEEGVLTLDRDSALCVALINSRNYQEELEDLYLSALDVTFERFRLDAQFFGGNSTFFTADGPSRSGDAQSLLEVDNTLEMNKLFASGGELVVGLANSLVWQFAGPDEYSATTLLDFSLVQPLLRGAGRAVVLERLTDSQRALLANIRQMERFRRAFYAEVVNGRRASGGPNRGGVTLGNLVVGGGIGTGILGLMEEQVRIRNQRTNVAQLRSSLELFEDLYAGDRVDRLQVDQVRQQLYNSQSRLLAITTAYEDSLDTYKIQLGLPPSLQIKIEDPLLRQFDFIDPRMADAQEKLTALLITLNDPDNGLEKDELTASARAATDACSEMLATAHKDVAKLIKVLPQRKKNLQRLLGRDEFAAGDIEASVASVSALEGRAVKLQEDLLVVDREVANSVKSLEVVLQGGGDDLADKLRQPLDELAVELGELLLIQAAARVDSVTLVQVDMNSEAAYEIAKCYRRDWKNARAALVDQWRQIEVAANDLRSGLDVTFSGDINTSDNNPVRFRGTTGRLRVGLEFDAPLTRLAERNAYREVLIEYQRAKRDYYAYEDDVSQELRSILRSMRLNQLNFELSRAAVHVAISQVEITQFRLREPPQPGQPARFGATTARDLVSALSGLLSAQNELLGVWVAYEVDRLNLDLELGTMELDCDGRWIDPGPIDDATLERYQAMGPAEEIPLPDPLPLEDGAKLLQP